MRPMKRSSEKQYFYDLGMRTRVLAALILKNARQDLERRLQKTHASIHITPLQVGVLGILHSESTTLSEISKLMFLRPATLVPVIEQLERHKLIVRTKDKKDRRRTPLALTTKGSELFLNLFRLDAHAQLAVALKNMGRKKSEQLTVLLEELVRQFPEGGVSVERLHKIFYEKLYNKF